MSIIPNIQRIERMHQMILTKRTGAPDVFAKKIGLSRSMMYYWIKDLKVLGAPIVYCRARNSFTYVYPVDFIIKFDTPAHEKKENKREVMDIELWQAAFFQKKLTDKTT